MKSYLALISLLLFTSGLAAQTPRGNVRVPSRPPFADSIPTAARAPIRRSVGDADAEGAGWVRRTEPTFQPANRGAEHFATAASRKCVDASSGGVVRSGDFVIGGEIDGPATGRQVKIWWEPMHPAESFSLVVRGASLRPTSDTLRYTNSGWAIGGSPSEGTLGPIFYASGIAFPSSGRWLLIATSGPDWGCFIVTTS